MQFCFDFVLTLELKMYTKLQNNNINNNKKKRQGKKNKSPANLMVGNLKYQNCCNLSIDFFCTGYKLLKI